MAKPSLLTTTVGSYPVPLWLRTFGTKEHLRDAVLVVLKIQELAGIDLLVDGELYRWDINHPETNGMIDYFIRPMTGVQTSFSRKTLETFRRQSALAYRAEPAGIVVETLGAGTLNLLKDFEFIRPLTTKPLKFTLTSPYMLARVLLNQHYASFAELVLALADILAEQVVGINAEVIQIDEANLTGNPDDADLAAEAINRIFKNVQTQKAVHLCFGNYGGQRVQQGTYDRLVRFINRLQCDHMVLEMARRPESDKHMLVQLKPEMGIGLGVIDIKDNQVESPEEIARRIEEVARLVGAERIHYVHPDCGLWMLPRSVADAKLRNLVRGRDLFLGR
ncbi:MAG: cobalamin-independent methionine synthase II family protein [candidate division KSB1 bacterium]|nr:cobalamin-independent methionine synthase II family protein [candidate division KSB1 bacterium]MDZ7276330.1 cobalamin-independent methionine synthase II family protein [candidate division KSB1 bacterium]MDZ7287717.1 cobalamin-independent methionine synthase II family protein [candidate division KSB1 bacterium]MDZ7299943.1 cobalamin-independent methionine synthase II family protein [candidate division KSB1 bacterium]MDZ7305728.1 cobalamin-independent methionine synthase II family protein [can